MKIMKLATSLTAILILSSCSATSQMPESEEAIIGYKTQAGKVLKSLPAAKRKIVLSVYKFSDLTGQHKPNDNFSEYSRAVTQGGVSILTNALMKAGKGSWFTVAERGGLQNLLQERKIIRTMRDQYAAKDGSKLPNIPPLLYAGILLEGGITSYETNVITGGIGARYLGIGASTQYRRDIVTIHLRAISVQTGEVLLSIDTSKTIYSSSVTATMFKFVSFDKLLEIDSGFSTNEPPQLAVRQAIETAVYSLIMEGREKGVWGFADKIKGKIAFENYISRRDGVNITKESKKAVTKDVNFNKASTHTSATKKNIVKKQKTKKVVKKMESKDKNVLKQLKSTSSNKGKNGKAIVKTNFNKNK